MCILLTELYFCALAVSDFKDYTCCDCQYSTQNYVYFVPNEPDWKLQRSRFNNFIAS